MKPRSHKTQLRLQAKFKADLARISKATEKAIKSMQECYAVGVVFCYRHGRNWVWATVIEHGFGLSIKVRGHNSGKEYWIDPYRCV